MSLHGPRQPPSISRPPPLRVDSSRTLSSGSNDYKPLPKTPGSKITSFFGWKNVASPGAESTSTEISDSGISPLPSPNPASLPSGGGSKATSRDSYFATMPRAPSRSQTIPMESNLSLKVTEMENELREISSELAGSIRREMDLEDMIERLQLETSIAPDPNRRTSDYFSDSGNSSGKYPPSDAGYGKLEDIDKLKRSFEQQHAKLKVELSQRWHEERSWRQAAESHVQMLEAQISQFRREKVDASNISSKAKELEASLEDTRRRLAEERELKDNYEDLLTGMRVELEQHRNERDQLENRLQLEIRSLRGENAALSQAKKSQFDTQRINSIAEEGDSFTARVSGGLSRSNSVARAPPNRTGLTRSGSVSRPTSMIIKDRDFKDSLADTVKDVEMQRDALHQTLKNLIRRQALEGEQNRKRIRVLELELDRTRQSSSPRRKGYEKEVTTLREEINLVRQRADDALDQKWQCEKGLAGLKMDLDRAKQETNSLRALLREHDIAVPAGRAVYEDEVTDFQTTVMSLEAEYEQFRAETKGSGYEATELNETLAKAVHRRVALNKSLKERLSQAIGKGERDQELSATKINEMQASLRVFEETVMIAQQHAEEEVAKHEQEINALKQSHSAHLLRAKSSGRSPGMLSPILPSSPFSGARSPRLSQTSSGPGLALSQAVQIHDLEAKVKGLEKALRDADMEMGEVVSRMNQAQIEVAELQFARDEALRETRLLRSKIHEERQRFES